MSGKSNFLIVAVAGLAVGIGIGLLIAPETGAKTRKKIRNKILDIADRIEDGIPANFEELREVFSPAKAPGEPGKDAGANTESGTSSF